MRALLLILLFSSACSGPAPGEGPGPESCADLASEGDSWAPDADGPDGQIHPRTVLAQQTLWTAWNRPDEDGSFSVWIGAHACDGEVVVAPVRLDGGDGNATDPDLAIGEDGVFVVWQRDFPQGDFNLSVRWARVGLDGEVLAADEELVFEGPAGALQGQAWMARVVPAEGGWLVAAVRADPGGVFHPVVQGLGSEGEPAGAVVVVGDPAAEGFEPSLARTDAGPLVGWQKSFDGSAGYGLAEVGEAPAEWSELESVGVGISVAWDGRTHALMGRGAGLAYGVFGEVARDVGAGSGFVSGPDLRMEGGGAFGAWNEGPASRATVFARSLPDGDLVEVAEGVGGYAASIVPLGGGLAAVTVAEGTSPGFRLRSRVVDLGGG